MDLLNDFNIFGLSLGACNFLGLAIGACTFLIIGFFHPIVIKCEYYFGTGCWWWFLVLGILCILASMLAESVFLQAVLGVTGFSSFWTIKELFDQRRRVEKGWFPRNPKRCARGYSARR